MPQKVMMIDDEAGIAKVVGLTAERLGLDFRSVTTPEHAVDQFLEYNPDIVFLDMIMPGKDGIDVLNEILATGVPTKIVLVSGYGDGYLNLAEGLGAFHGSDRFPILKKPFRNAQLVELLTGMTNGA
ncbi:MAG: response regulator [Acetobacteraceae bacterium]|nr:response regulator [Pseudomonadota bacterium]